jgi:raffinose/stachyose/melibiose transport system substrate-binding protein
MKHLRPAPLATIAGAAALVAASSAAGVSAAAGSHVNVTMWVNPPAVVALKKIDAEFEKAHPGISVNLTTAVNEYTNYAALEKTAVEGGTEDVMATQAINPLPIGGSAADLMPEQLWGTSGVYLPLNGQPWVKRLKSTAVAVETYKGKLYGMNTGSYQYGVYYNKAIFAKYHIAIPTTYAQFIAVCQTLKKDGVTPLYDGLGGGAQGYLYFILYPMMQALWLPHAPGKDLNTALWTGKAQWTSPYFIQAMKQEKQVAQYLEPNYTGESWTTMPTAFAAGKAAMLLDGSWDLSAVFEANPHIQVGYFPLPGGPNPALDAPILQTDLTWVILSRAKDQAAAKTWLDFFASPKIYSQYVATTGISPSFNGTYNSQTEKVLGPKYFGNGVLAGDIFPVLPAGGPFVLQLNNFWSLQLNMVQGQKTPQQVAQTLEQAWTQVIHH